MFVYATIHYIHRQQQRINVSSGFNLMEILKDIFWNKRCYEMIEIKNKIKLSRYYDKINNGRKIRYNNILFIFDDTMTVLKSVNVRDISYFKRRKTQSFLENLIGGYLK